MSSPLQDIEASLVNANRKMESSAEKLDILEEKYFNNSKELKQMEKDLLNVKQAQELLAKAKTPEDYMTAMELGAGKSAGEITKLEKKTVQLKESTLKNKDALEKQRLEYDKNIRSVEMLENQFGQLKNAGEETTKHINTGFTLMKGIVSNVVGNLISKTINIVSSSIKNAVQMASSLTEIQNVVNTTFGESSQIINDWSLTTLDAYGLSETSAKRYVSTLGSMIKASGITGNTILSMSKDLTALSGDIASFYNLKSEDAFRKLQSAVGGNATALQDLGIKMSVANLQTFAVTLGIKKQYKELDQAQQTMLRYKYIMQATRDAQGDFAKTSDSFANQQRLLKERWQSLVITIAQNVLPVMTKLTSYTNLFIQKLSLIGPHISSIIPYVIGIGSVLSVYFIPILIQMGVQALITGTKVAFAFTMANLPLLVLIGTVITIIALWNNFGQTGKVLAVIIGTLATVIGVITVAQWAWNVAMISNPIGVIVMAIAGLIAIIVALILWIKNLWKYNADFKISVLTAWAEILNFFDGVPLFFQGVGDGILNAFDWAKVGTLKIMESMGNGVIDIINKIIKGINLIPKISIPILEKLTLSAGASAEAEFRKAERKFKLDEQKTQLSIKAEERIANIDKDRIRQEAELAKQEKDRQKQQKELPAGYGGFDFADFETDTSDGKALKTKNTTPIKFDEENLKMLHDIALRDYQINYKQLTPQISLNINDMVVRETADINSIIDVIADSLAEIVDSDLGVPA